MPAKVIFSSISRYLARPWYPFQLRNRFGIVHSMMTSSNGTFSTLLALCAENSPVTGEFPAQRSVTWTFDYFITGHRWNPHKGPVTRKMFSFDDVIMTLIVSVIFLKLAQWCQRSNASEETLKNMAKYTTRITKQEIKPAQNKTQQTREHNSQNIFDKTHGLQNSYQILHQQSRGINSDRELPGGITPCTWQIDKLFIHLKSNTTWDLAYPSYGDLWTMRYNICYRICTRFHNILFVCGYVVSHSVFMSYIYTYPSAFVSSPLA